MKRVLAIAMFACALTGCVSITGVQPGERAMVDEAISVDPQIAWASINIPGSSGTRWTVDGFGLQEIQFYLGTEAGDPFLNVQGIPRDEMPAYDATMLPDDVMEMVAATLTRTGYLQVEASGLTPAPFGNAQGFKFQLTMSTQEGLLVKGNALAAQRNGTLDLILFIAAAEYYYDQYAPTVERVFSSVQVL